MRVVVFVLMMFLAGFVCAIEAQAQCPVPDEPPRATLIRVSNPDANGDVTVTGVAGAVVVQSASDKVVLVNLETGHFASTVAAPDGSFSATGYCRFGDQYALQIGMGRSGDLPNDIKFQCGAAVLRGSAFPQPHYAIYGSLFVLVPDGEPGGGTRVFPPFQGNGGGPSGGPIMKLKGQDIDLFIHLTGVRPGSVLEVGDNFSLAGAVGPPLPALVSTKVTTPSGRTLQFSGRANRVGYYYRPQDDFAVTEPGIYTVDVRVTFDGQTSAGQVSEPFPTGDVLGSAQGRFL